MTTTMSPYQQFIHQTRYARWLETEKRRETWEETATRYTGFFKQEKANTPELKALLDECKQYILDMKVMPSMRALMTSGEALKRENIAGFNCSYIAINNKRAFSEALYILMCGTGVGFSCERQEVAKLPVVPESLQPSEDVIVVGDSKEGWAKAYAKLLSALYAGDIPKVDYSKLRPAGARLKTFGGRACLTGDTKVYRSGKKTRGHLELTINDLMDMKHKSNHWKRIKLRSVNEQTGELYYNQLVDIIDNGIAPVYKLVTENGYCIKATDTHRFMDSTGEWKQLKNFTIGEEITVNGSEKKTGNCADCGVEVSRRAKRCKFCHDQTRIKADALDTTARQRKHNRNYCKDYCEKCGITDTRFEVHHIDKNPLNNEHSNLLNLCSPCHQLIHAQERTLGDGFSHRYITWDKIISITLVGEERVYDLSMQTPDHNFIANGIVSHNSGSKPLQKLFEFTINKFKHSLSKKLTSIDVHDIMCMVGEIVVVGGVRRSALISLSNLSDQRMRDAKSGQWWIDNPQRGLANNSVAYTEKPSAEIFMEEWLALVKSKSGERGIFNRVAAQNQAAKYGRRSFNHSYGTNPCCLSGDTLVLTDYGHLPIIELVGKNTNVWNGNEFSSVVPFSVGIHPTLEITLSNGVSLKCTHNHKFVLRDTEKHTRLPSEKRVEAKDLVIGDKLFKYSMPVITAGEDYSTDAYSQGFYSGDGNTDLNYSWIYEPKYVCKPRLVGTFSEDHSSVARCTWKHGQMLSKAFVPVNGSLDYRLNWLAGLLDADGCVTSDKNGNGFQIASVDKDFLLSLRLMLTTLGVQAKVVNAHDAENRDMPDGKGGSKEYPCQAVHRLLIGNMDVWRLGKLGLKTERLQWHTDQPQRCASRYITVTSVKSLEPEEHFCFDEPKNHTGTFNGIVTGQSEIILRDKQFCNLTEVIVREGDDINILSEKVRIATILGTFQASLTKFNFLSETWTKNTEEEALLGVSMTGIMDNTLTAGLLGHNYLAQVLEHLRTIAVETNKQIAELLGIKPSAAITCVKPSGTVSQLCDTASGIHARHNHHYIRTVRIDKKDPVYTLLKHQGVPIEDDAMRPDSTAVVSFPQVAPKGCITRNDMTAIEQLELWLIYQRNWCEHKPSVTITVKEHEWLAVGAWVYEHFDEVSGISFLPHSDHTYQQAPYQDMTEESLNQWIKDNPSPVIDWSLLPMFEKEDETISSQALACVAGVCEI